MRHVPDDVEAERLRLELRLGLLEAQSAARTNFLSFAQYVWPEAILGAHHRKMAEAFDRIANGTLKRLIINMPPRHRLSLDTEVPTTAGWKTIAQIQPGDYVFAPDGSPVLVTGKSDIYRERLYEVTSIDGHKVRCDGEHLWTVRFGPHKFQTYNTEQLWRREQGEHLCTTRSGEVIFRGQRSETSENRPAILPVNEAVEYPEASLPVDPYVLGLWLGDGHNQNGIITAHDDDAAIIRPEIERRGYRTTDQATRMTFGILGLKVALRELGVLGNKHIPALYLTASKGQRLDLLRGLMDSDGNVSKAGQCMFSQKSLSFITQVRELLNSLGVKNTLHSSEAKIGDKSYGTTYRLSFYMKGCCFLPRKAERTFDPAYKNRARSVRFERLDEYGEVQCLQVANEDGLFLVGRGYLTGHNTKSEFASYLLPAFLMGRDPRLQIIEATHTAELAVRFGRKVRDLMDTEKYAELFPEVQLKVDSKAAGRWDTNRGGQYFAVGVGGAVTGRGADLLIIDDPHSEQDAMSELALENAWEWYQGGPRTRLQPGGAVVVVMTRWGTRDLTARLLKAQASHGADKWEVIEFPAILPSGKPLWPEFWKIEELEAVRASLSVQKWNAMYQQQPTNDEGAILKREWWKRWQYEEPPPVDYLIQSYDTAYSKKETADYSVITTWGVFYPSEDEGAHIILLGVKRGRWDFPELKRVALDEYKFWNPDNVLIEAKATGTTLQQEMRRAGIPVTMYAPGGRRSGTDKVSRAHSVAPMLESGMVWAPETDWADELVEECAAFPNGDHDDMVDSTTQALMRFRQGNFLKLAIDEDDDLEQQEGLVPEYY